MFKIVIAAEKDVGDSYYTQCYRFISKIDNLQGQIAKLEQDKNNDPMQDSDVSNISHRPSFQMGDEQQEILYEMESQLQ